MKDRSGFLYLNAGNEWPLLQLDHLAKATDGSLTLMGVSGAVDVRGAFFGGPFSAPPEMGWFRLSVQADELPAGSHLQLFTFTANSGSAPFVPAVDDPFSDPGWYRAPRDVFDVLVLNPPSDPKTPDRLLWVGGILRSDGTSSAVLRQMRIDYGRDTYLEFLPGIYRQDAAQRDFLERFLSLQESVLGGLDVSVTDLPLLFDPHAAPAEGFHSWLSWLAGWLAFDLSEQWPQEQKREFLAQAFALYGKRGTVAGLRSYLKMYAGVEARIEEPGAATSLWRLDGSASLGFTTMLAPGDWRGAILDGTATLDRSYLMRGDTCGDALFEDIAHRFCVQIYCGELTRPGALEEARAVLDREKPAHTVYHLCVIEPNMRVGSQARVGIDAIVGGGPPVAHLGGRLDTGVLATDAEPCETREET